MELAIWASSHHVNGTIGIGTAAGGRETGLCSRRKQGDRYVSDLSHRHCSRDRTPLGTPLSRCCTARGRACGHDWVIVLHVLA